MSEMFNYEDIKSLCSFAHDNFSAPGDIDYLIKNNFGILDALRRERQSHRDAQWSKGRSQAYFDRRIANTKSVIWCLVSLKKVMNNAMLKERDKE